MNNFFKLSNFKKKCDNFLVFILNFMRNHLIGASLLLGSFIAPSIAEESKGFYLSIGGAQTFIQDVEGDTTISGTK